MGAGSFFDICPKTDPKLLSLSNIDTLESAAYTQFSDRGKYLDTYDCGEDLGINLEGISTYLKPADKLTTGTATLSNVAGTATAPASDSVFSYTNGADGKVYTITAAGKFNDPGSGSGSGSSSDTGSGSGPGSTSGSSSGSGDKASASPSQTSKPKNAAAPSSASRSLVTLAVAMCARALL